MPTTTASRPIPPKRTDSLKNHAPAFPPRSASLIPPYSTWINETKATGRRRSKELKALDAAVQSRNLQQIRNALKAWQDAQTRAGKKWESSVRNRTAALFKLARIVDPDAPKRRAEEEAAMRALREMQRDSLRKQFAGKSVEFKCLDIARESAGSVWEDYKESERSKKDLRTVQRGAKKVHKHVSRAAHTTIGQHLRKIICSDLCEGIPADEVLRVVGLGTAQSFVSNATPYLGALGSAKDAVKAIYGLGRAVRQRQQVTGDEFAIKPGDAKAAFNAVLGLINDKVKSKAKDSAVATGALTAKALGLGLCDTAVGILEALHKIFSIIKDHADLYRERAKANKALQAGQLDLKLFEISPLLGCYFLLMQDHSTIIDLSIDHTGGLHFVDHAELLRNAVEPVLEAARGFVDDSKLEIPGFANAKGVVTKSGRLDKVPDELKDEVTGHFEGKIFGE